MEKIAIRSFRGVITSGRLGRFLLVAAVLLALAGGIILTDYNMRQLQGADEGCLSLDRGSFRRVAVRASASAAALVDNCRGLLEDVREVWNSRFGE